MKPGLDRTDVGYAWPSTILMPSDFGVLVYLDLNHWIGMAKAELGHRDGGLYDLALKAARRAKADGRAVFPLSAAHYEEVRAIKDPKQRSELAAVMGELSGFRTLASHPLIMHHEVDAALDGVLGRRPGDQAGLDLIGHGFGHAFGQIVSLRIERSDGTDATDEARAAWPGGPQAFDEMLASTAIETQRRMLAGPKDEDLPRLRELGYKPESARAYVERRAQQEREFQRKLNEDTSWRRYRLRDVVSARYLANEAGQYLAESLAARGAQYVNVCANRDAARRFVDSMPSGDAYVTLTTASHQNAQLTWQSNDVFDIDAMAIAIAYCDVVVTERHRAHQAKVTGLATRLQAEVVADPSELVSCLERGTGR